MLFNSYSFIFLFLPVTFGVMFWLARHSHRLAALWLGLASLTFYAVWDARFVLLLLISIGFNYGAGYWIGLRRAAGDLRQARQALVAAITTNLVFLGYFKYTNFFIDSVNQFFGSQWPALDIILPLGISFFTFTQIAFLVDVHRGLAKEYNFIHYLLFVTWFPHLIAGPVIHHKQMMSQFAHAATWRLNQEHVAVGLTIFVLGLAKKVLIADNLAEFATPVFTAASAGQTLAFYEAWAGALAYTLQLYFDFSAYSDMAIGLSLMFNVRLPLNFNSPYKATSIIDFWRRWHMTLSAFLRDYLYIPLGGNRKGPARRYLNLMATMLLGGLWHGAGWTFIVWGGLHGLYLMVNHGWRELKERLGWKWNGRLARLAAGALTFVAVVIAWVYFRADSLATAHSVLAGMAGLNGTGLDGFIAATGAKPVKVFKTIAIGLLIVWLLPNARQFMQRYKPTWNDLGERAGPVAGERPSRLAWQPSLAWALGFAVLLTVTLASMSHHSEFLYFQF